MNLSSDDCSFGGKKYDHIKSCLYLGSSR